MVAFYGSPTAEKQEWKMNCTVAGNCEGALDRVTLKSGTDYLGGMVLDVMGIWLHQELKLLYCRSCKGCCYSMKGKGCMHKHNHSQHRGKVLQLLMFWECKVQTLLNGVGRVYFEVEELGRLQAVGSSNDFGQRAWRSAVSGITGDGPALGGWAKAAGGLWQQIDNIEDADDQVGR
ncbi:hypothetical protein BS17DRAFT_764362 [Gyrodon lividus]|nr:hypothetical protein BS17DRAFT_764362 [Gyrodon lividus]